MYYKIMMAKTVYESIEDILKPKLPKEIKQALEKFKPNKLVSMGINGRNPYLIKTGIKGGASNTDIVNHEAFIIAVQNNDVELLKLLLKDEKNNPGRGGDYEIQSKYKKYDNRPIRLACQNGLTEMVKLLLRDSRVDPSTDKQFPLRHAIKNNHWDIVEMLINDKRVIEDLSQEQMTKIIKTLILKIRN